jgi:hypothetical protein
MNTRLPIDIPAIEQFYRIEEDGSVFSLSKQRYLRAVPNTAGYLHVCLHLYMPHKWFLIHRLCSTKYNGECPSTKEACHDDGDKYNNHYLNIVYKTHSENIKQSFEEHGREPNIGFRHTAPHSFAAKQLMAEAKKKAVMLSYDGTETIFPSIEVASQSLNTYRKKIYNCIKHHKEFFNKKDLSLGGVLSFV